MISVEEAKQLIRQNVEPLPVHSVPLSLAAGHLLAADEYAVIDIPAYEQSSMDGYAIRFEDYGQPLIIQGEMQAGTTEQFTLLPLHAARIFTGAPLPAGADTVVMQEKVDIREGKLIILDTKLSKAVNVRHKGAEAHAGQLAIAKGSRLTPAALGFLAGIGKTHVSVHYIPSVAIIATGKELQRPGQELSFGQVYESNSYALSAALKRAYVSEISLYSADDNLEELTSVLQEALQKHDLVLLTGGVSVGDYDFVLRAAQLLEIEQVFHKVKQKPGKPLYFGKKGDKVVFGLPGNPSSVLSCFYQYVLPALQKLTGGTTVCLEVADAVLSQDFHKPAGLTQFIKAQFTDGIVSPLQAQESFRMSSFAQANGMIELPADHEDFPAGSSVKVHLFPG
jgi:molybdopterin molybdotransferase